jgi:hypothetical protein
MKYIYRCPHCGAEDQSLERNHAAFAVDRQCAECKGWARVQIGGPNLEFSVAKGASPILPAMEGKFGYFGYCAQLDRSRRFLERMKASSLDPLESQDMAWAFFQNCWHVKDWLKMDLIVHEQPKRVAIDMAHQSPILKICQELCNGTKHLLTHAAIDDHIAYTMHARPPGAADIPNEIDCIIDDGTGRRLSGKNLAEDCIAEWERILQSQGLATAQPS